MVLYHQDGRLLFFISPAGNFISPAGKRFNLIGQNNDYGFFTVLLAHTYWLLHYVRKNTVRKFFYGPFEGEAFFSSPIKVQ